MDTVTISLREYEILIDRDRWLSSLEVAGVEDWEGIEEAMYIYSEEYEEDDYFL